LSALVALAGGVMACRSESPPASGDGPGPSRPGPTSSIPADPGGSVDSSDERARKAVLAQRYRAYWDAFDAARQSPTVTPEVSYPRLAELAAGDQLETSYQSLVDLAAVGEAVREPAAPSTTGTDAAAEHRVRVDRIDGTVAELTGCTVNDDVRYEVATDTVVGGGVSTIRSTATMALTGGNWRLIRSQAVEISDGVTGCWLNAADFPD
jgi:hypothetical protein